MLKSVGFTPRQVMIVYIGQVTIPAAVGTKLGLRFGNLVAIPLLAQAQQAYDVAAVAGLRPWVWVTVPLALLTFIALTAAGAA